MATESIKKISKSLNGWNGHSKNGQSKYDRIFELEKQEEENYYKKRGRCSCCNREIEDCQYIGID